jgi:hypothetical protein
MITEVQGGEFHSSVTNKIYSSKEAAVFYENQHKQQHLAANSRVADFMATLTPEQTADLEFVFSTAPESAHAERQNLDTLQEWYKANPQVAFAGEAGYRNGAVMRTWLQTQHRHGNYTVFDWENAYQALEETGSIAHTGVPAPAKTDAHVSPLDAPTNYILHR